MAEGYHDFVAGDKPTAADLEDYCELQGDMRFASAAARDTALSVVKVEGMSALLKDVNTRTTYSGTAWSTTGPLYGALTAFTPVITQSGTVTATVNNSTYSRVGRQITWRFTLTVTGSGTAANLVTVSLPVNINYVADFGPCGHFQLYDTSAGGLFTGPAVPAAAGTIKGTHTYAAGSGLPGFLGVSGFTAALAAGDTISGFVSYEAAADA